MSDSGRVIGMDNPHHPNYAGQFMGLVTLAGETARANRLVAALAESEAENARLRAEVAELRAQLDGWHRAALEDCP